MPLGSWFVREKGFTEAIQRAARWSVATSEEWLPSTYRRHLWRRKTPILAAPTDSNLINEHYNRASGVAPV